MTDTLKQAKFILCDFWDYAFKAGSSKVQETKYWVSRADSEREKLLSLISDLKEERDLYKALEKKAFWWSAEFTSTCHSNNINSAWNDYLSGTYRKSITEGKDNG